MSDRIVVVGGGIGGLVCTTELVRAGRHVLLVEAARDVGGRVATTARDGFLLDRGFQVLFEAYPTLQRYADLASLDMRWCTRGAHVIAPSRRAFIGDALGDPSLLWPTLRDGALTLFDLWRMVRLRAEVMRRPLDECFDPEWRRQSTDALLRERGFSASTIERFFAPFSGGILLDRSLATSASVLLYTFKMLAEGRAGVPAKGMGALPARIAAMLPPGRIRTGTSVASIMTADGRVTGVRLADGSVLEAAHVVLATDGPAMAALAATAGVTLSLPAGALGVTTVYFSAPQPVLPGRALYLNARPDPTISHAITMSDVASEYAPSGQHLVSATAIGAAAELDEDVLIEKASDDVAFMASKDRSTLNLRHLETVRVPYAQYPQPPGMGGTGVSAATALRGLWLAGELLHTSSLEGAARGGAMAASAILGEKRR